MTRRAGSRILAWTLASFIAVVLPPGCIGPTEDGAGEREDETSQVEETETAEGTSVSFDITTTGLFPYAVERPGFDPHHLKVSWGDQVTINLHNKDLQEHTWNLEVNYAIYTGTGHVAPLESGSVRFDAPAPGEYTFYCSHADHRELGQTGVLTVTAP